LLPMTPSVFLFGQYHHATKGAFVIFENLARFSPPPKTTHNYENFTGQY
jgi:hypothetical protein